MYCNGSRIDGELGFILHLRFLKIDPPMHKRPDDQPRQIRPRIPDDRVFGIGQLIVHVARTERATEKIDPSKPKACSHLR